MGGCRCEGQAGDVALVRLAEQVGWALPASRSLGCGSVDRPVLPKMFTSQSLDTEMLPEVAKGV